MATLPSGTSPAAGVAADQLVVPCSSSCPKSRSEDAIHHFLVERNESENPHSNTRYSHYKCGQAFVYGMSVPQVWSFVANTDMLNRAMGLNPSTTTYLKTSVYDKNDNFGTRMIPRRRVEWNVETDKGENVTKLVFEEEAFQWDQGAGWYLMTRSLMDDPHISQVAYLVSLSQPIVDTVVITMTSYFQPRKKIATTSHPNDWVGDGDNQNDAAQEAAFEAVSMHNMVPASLFEELSQRKSWFHQINDVVQKTSRKHVPSRFLLDPLRLKVGRRALLDLGEDPTVVNCLMEYLRQYAVLPSDLVDLQPLRWAHEQGLLGLLSHDTRVTGGNEENLHGGDSPSPKDEQVISCFLRASRIGLLEPRWAMVCPGCRGAKGADDNVAAGGGRRSSRIMDLPAETHCDDCNIRITADPKENVQLVFSPKEGGGLTVVGGSLSTQRACVGSPVRTRHFLAHAILEVNETRVVMDVAAPSAATTGNTTTMIGDTATAKNRLLRLRCPQLNASHVVNDDGKQICGTWHLTQENGFCRTESQAPSAPSIQREGDIDGVENRGAAVTTFVEDHVVVVHNLTGQRVTVVVERGADPYAQALLAKEVLTHSGFASIFGSEEWEFLSTMVGFWEESFGMVVGETSSSSLSSSNLLCTMPDKDSFDLVIVGSGPAGESLALTASNLGAKVALIEKEEFFGGPTGLGSKAFREAALKVLNWARMNEGRPTSESVRAIFDSQFCTFRDYVITLVSHELMSRLAQAGVCLVRGRGKLETPKKLAVQRPDGNVMDIAARNVALAVGSRPARPADVPFDHVRVLDGQEISKISRLPVRIAIVGGGIIACEYACIFGCLGVQTHLINAYPTFLPMLDRGLCRGLLDAMQREGVVLHKNAKITKWNVGQKEDDVVSLTLMSGKHLSVDMVLYAQGREGQTDGLVATSSEISIPWANRGYFKVDHDMSFPGFQNIFALGDVTGPPGLASSSMDQGRRLAESLFEETSTTRGLRSPEKSSSPLVLWTIPEVASIGLTHNRADTDQLSVLSARASYRELPRGLLSGDLNGWLELMVEDKDQNDDSVVDNRNPTRMQGRIVGVHILGPGASELIHFGDHLVATGMTCQQLAKKVFAAVTLHDLFQLAAMRATTMLRKTE